MMTETTEMTELLRRIEHAAIGLRSLRFGFSIEQSDSDGVKLVSRMRGRWTIHPWTMQSTTELDEKDTGLSLFALFKFSDGRVFCSETGAQPVADAEAMTDDSFMADIDPSATDADHATWVEAPEHVAARMTEAAFGYPHKMKRPVFTRRDQSRLQLSDSGDIDGRPATVLSGRFSWPRCAERLAQSAVYPKYKGTTLRCFGVLSWQSPGPVLYADVRAWATDDGIVHRVEAVHRHEKGRGHVKVTARYSGHNTTAPIVPPKESRVIPMSRKVGLPWESLIGRDGTLRARKFRSAVR